MSTLAGPVWVTSVDVADGAVELHVPRRDGQPYARVRVLVRNGHRPVRFVEQRLDDGPIFVVSGADQRPAPPSISFVGNLSVVVCTRDRPDQLGRCLAALAELEDPDFDVVIVDNSASGSAASVFEQIVGCDERFRLVREPRPGLSRARNRGLAVATGEVVAFTDDDVRVDPAWLTGIREGFTDGAVGCVTGLVPAAELEDPVQELFEKKVSWSSSLDRRRYSMETDGTSGAFPYDAGRFGTGANFAVRASVMRELGGFDVALGAGSHSRGGEDLDAFVRILLAGHDLVYEPQAIVWHVHRTSDAELARQVYAYGVGLTAYITKLLTGPHRRDVLRRVGRGAAVFVGDKRGERSNGLPRSLVIRELAGCLAGPAAYFRARRER